MIKVVVCSREKTKGMSEVKGGPDNWCLVLRYAPDGELKTPIIWANRPFLMIKDHSLTLVH
jgi:hypothetical protein